jgi:exopolyphosphatase/guanosine-5'-triphosphate,3'-diphosphate pyrophosphatase
MPVAILDFGTNTFNLLIAEKKEGGFDILYSGKQGVKLGRGGIQDEIITPEAMDRGFNAIEQHLEIIRKFSAEANIQAYATAAIRSARNGEDFVSQVNQRYGLSVQVIDGKREAELIYKGVSQAVPIPAQNIMILDIGGGSNEFIICNNEKVHWKHSFDLGMARILERFTLSDPIAHEEIRILEDHFDKHMKLLFEHTIKYGPEILLGASGTFDTFRSLIAHKKGWVETGLTGMEIQMEDYEELHHALLRSTLEERKRMPGMELVRVEMIVAATIFVNFVIQSCGIKKMYQSGYALKEGVMAELAGI